MKKVGIYIDAFDPVQKSNIRFAHDALVQAKLDKVYLLVEPVPRSHQGVKALAHRINMTMQAVEDDENLGTIALKSRTNTNDFIPFILKRFEDQSIYLIVPENRLSKFIRWSNLLDYDPKKFTLCIGLNDPNNKDALFKLEVLSQTVGINFKYKSFSSINPASTIDIKKSLKMGNVPKELDPGVYDYIINNKLYFASA